MSLPRYTQYKDSGVPWLGSVPTHWSLVRLRYVSDIQTGERDTENAVEDGRYPFFVRSQTIERIDSLAFEGEAILTAGDGAGVGKVFHHYDGAFDFHQRVYMLSGFREVHGRFLFHYLRENFFKVALDGGAKSTVDSLRRPMFSNFMVAVPPSREQGYIAEFCDREAARIDALVAEQERLIELLKEKRQAVISHAVTMGLKPNAPMKDSGNPWLGDVPAHWDVIRLKYCIDVIEQGSSPQCENYAAEEGSWGVLKVGCGNGEVFDVNEQKALPLELEPDPRHQVVPGDILMSRGNTQQLVGMATLVGDSRVRLLLSDLLYRFRPLPARADAAFLVSQLRSPPARFQIERNAVGTSPSMKKISQGTIGGLVVCLPGVQEQREIIAATMGYASRLDQLVIEAQRAVDLLQERRAALICAAVTGQIDVRPESMRSAA